MVLVPVLISNCFIHSGQNVCLNREILSFKSQSRFYWNSHHGASDRSGAAEEITGSANTSSSRPQGPVLMLCHTGEWEPEIGARSEQDPKPLENTKISVLRKLFLSKHFFAISKSIRTAVAKIEEMFILSLSIYSYTVRGNI